MSQLNITEEAVAASGPKAWNIRIRDWNADIFKNISTPEGIPFCKSSRVKGQLKAKEARVLNRVWQDFPKNFANKIAVETKLPIRVP